jgi:importin subunit alpha-1
MMNLFKFQAVLDAGVLPSLHRLLNYENDRLVWEVCWLLSNITAGTENQIGSVLDRSGLLADLILLTGGHRSSRVRREAAWTISNALSGGNAEHKRRIINNGCIGPFCRVLSDTEDFRLIEVSVFIFIHWT